MYGPGGEQAALRTLRKLPRGRDRREPHAVEGAAGAFSLTLESDGVSLSVRLDAGGARLQSVAT